MPIDPELARLRASNAGNTYWSRVTNRTAATAPMRAGFLEKLSREARERLGPSATDEQVAKAADNALKAHYAKMRANSILSRRRKTQQEQRAEAEALVDAIADAEAEPARVDGAA
jgi:hypothetical protein